MAKKKPKIKVNPKQKGSFPKPAKKSGTSVPAKPDAAMKEHMGSSEMMMKMNSAKGSVKQKKGKKKGK